MGIMAVGTGHLSFHDRMAERQAKLGLLIEVTRKTEFRIAARVEDIVFPAPFFNVDATGPVAHFTALRLPTVVCKADP